jgi:tetratricopeptide (TPR) repeat protein
MRALSGADPSGSVAALAHLGRAVGEARDSTFPAERLATMALEMARRGPDVRTIEAALRTLDAASAEAPGNAALEAAAAALSLRLGRPADAIVRAERAVERDAARAFSHAILAEAKRVSGDLRGARHAITAAIAIDERDPHVQNERAAILVATGDALGAQAEWQKLLASHPEHVAAFANLASIAIDRGDATLAQSIVDHALTTRATAPIEMLRLALQVALQAEGASVARGARMASLCRSVIEREGKDGGAVLLLARALAEMGDRDAALVRLGALEQAARGSALAAEATRARLYVEEPLAAAAIDATIRAVSEAAPHDVASLDAIATRARRLGVEHDSWVAYLAAAMAERRLGRLARAALDATSALAVAPTAPLVHVEMALVLLATKDSAAAVTHARRAVDLDASAPRAWAVLAEALATSGNRDEAVVAVGRAHAMAPADAHMRSLRDRITRPEQARPRWIDKLLKR